MGEPKEPLATDEQLAEGIAPQEETEVAFVPDDLEVDDDDEDDE